MNKIMRFLLGFLIISLIVAVYFYFHFSETNQTTFKGEDLVKIIDEQKHLGLQEWLISHSKPNGLGAIYGMPNVAIQTSKRMLADKDSSNDLLAWWIFVIAISC